MSLPGSFQALTKIANHTRNKSHLYHLHLNNSSKMIKAKMKKKADKRLSKREVNRLYYKEHSEDIKKKKVLVLSDFQINNQIKL
jgi:hypothetical protein